MLSCTAGADMLRIRGGASHGPVSVLMSCRLLLRHCHCPVQGVCSRVCAISDGEAPLCDRKLLSLVAEILFMENSRPVHRQLLSGLHRMPPGRFEVLKECIKLKVSYVRACILTL